MSRPDIPAAWSIVTKPDSYVGDVEVGTLVGGDGALADGNDSTGVSYPIDYFEGHSYVYAAPIYSLMVGNNFPFATALNNSGGTSPYKKNNYTFPNPSGSVVTSDPLYNYRLRAKIRGRSTGTKAETFQLIIFVAERKPDGLWSPYIVFNNRTRWSLSRNFVLPVTPDIREYELEFWASPGIPMPVHPGDPYDINATPTTQQVQTLPAEIVRYPDRFMVQAFLRPYGLYNNVYYNNPSPPAGSEYSIYSCFGSFISSLSLTPVATDDLSVPVTPNPGAGN